MQEKDMQSLLDAALEAFASTNPDGSIGEAAEADASARPNFERGGSVLRLGDIISFPTKALWAKNNYHVFNYVGGCSVVIERNGYNLPATFLASYFNRALREVKNGEETGQRIRCTGKPVEDFLGFGGTEASAIRAMAGAVIKVTTAKRVSCKVFDHTDNTVTPPVSVYRNGHKSVYSFEYITLPESLRPKTDSGSKGGSKSNSKGAKPTPAVPNSLS